MTEDYSNYKYNYYGFIPNKGGNIFFLVVWAILTICQIALTIPTSEIFFGVSMSIGCALELIGYIGRTIGNGNPYVLSNYMMNSLGTVISPVFFMAGIYNCFGATIEMFGKKYSPLKPINYRRIFISLDVVSFLVQGSGGGVAASSNRDTAQMGFHIMLGGLILQVVTMSAFIIMVGQYFYKVHVNRDKLDQRYAELRNTSFFKAVMWSMCAAIFLIYIRSVYRVAEMAKGWGSDIMHNEKLFLVLDGAMCAIAIILLTVFYPGFSFKRKRDFDAAHHVVEGDNGNSDISIVYDDTQIALKDLETQRSTI
ncbi:unnamed protein product [Ambrosiozyma monospora]|uniref:Sphingoid long-chain base transporter RSB1 n=1 Tax=Ambrosiozyma monospora TaxID=43982 RepID=A0A9W6YXI1_AMBMO|nr:unnamed protein product [Ambrosiozyma monospora]